MKMTIEGIEFSYEVVRKKSVFGGVNVFKFHHPNGKTYKSSIHPSRLKHLWQIGYTK